MRRLWPCLVVFLLQLNVYAVEATTYYVDPAGNDANAGTSLAAPFRTISKAASVVNPGDVVNVRGGTYGETVTLNRGGTVGNQVIFQRYQSETPVLDGTGLGSANGVVIGVPNIVWDGISIRNFSWPGGSIGGVRFVDMGDSTSYTIVRNTTINNIVGFGNPSCIYLQDFYAGTLEISNNILHDCGDASSANVGNRAGVTLFSDLLSTNATNLIWIHHNEIYNVGGGIKYKHASPPNPNATALFEYNLIHDVLADGNGCVSAEQPSTIIRYNICYNVPAFARAFEPRNSATEHCANCQIYNNSFYNVNVAIYTDSPTLTAHDNIFCTVPGGGSASEGAVWLVDPALESISLTSNYNLYCGASIAKAVVSGWAGSVVTSSFSMFQGMGYEGNGRTGDPLYVNPMGAPPDFHLRAGSPAKGAGTGGKDMGAYPTGTELIGPTSGGGGGGGGTGLCFDFRATSGYVTDPANCSPVLGEAYPHTYSNGITAGWNGGPATEDDSSSVDARLAGVNNKYNQGVQLTFRIDLDAAESKDIRAAFGNATNSSGYQYVQLLDDTTVIATIDQPTGESAGQWYDATGVLRTSNSDWVNNNAVLTHVFTSTILNIIIGTPTNPDVCCSGINHVRVTTSGGG